MSGNRLFTENQLEDYKVRMMRPMSQEEIAERQDAWWATGGRPFKFENLTEDQRRKWCNDRMNVVKSPRPTEGPRPTPISEEAVGYIHLVRVLAVLALWVLTLAVLL